MSAAEIKGRPPAIKVWLELDMEIEPVEGTLRSRDGRKTRFIGWLGLSAALARFRDRTCEQSEESP